MTDTNAPPARRPLRERILGGVGWSAASQIVLQVSRIAVALVLARLLAPHDYGLAAMVLVFSSLVLVFSDLGLGAALVQRKMITQHDCCTAFWTTIAAGFVFTAVAAALAGPLAGFYGESDVTPLCQVFALVFLITSVGATQEALLVREMNFKSLELRTMGATAVGAVTGIGVALQGGGPWALIAQQLTEAAIGSALLWFASPWRPRLSYSTTSLRNLWGFSGWIVGNRLLFYAQRNADNILIGRFIGAAPLGAYTIAYNVMLVPFSRIAGPIQRVLWPAFAELQDEPERIAAGWIRLTRILGAVAIPALVGLAIVAPDFVSAVLGPRWHQAAPLIQILALVGILEAVQVLDVDILNARGRTKLVFRYMLLFTIVHICAFAIGVHWGVIGVAVGYAISSVLVEPVLTVLTARELGTSAWRVPRALLGVVQATAAMALAVGGTRLAMAGAAAGPRLLACIAVGAAVYAIAAWVWVPELRAEARSVLRDARRMRVATPAAV